MFIHVTFKQAIRFASKRVEILSAVGNVDGYPTFAGLATGVGISNEQPRSRRQTITTEHTVENSNMASYQALQLVGIYTEKSWITFRCLSTTTMF